MDKFQMPMKRSTIICILYITMRLTFYKTKRSFYLYRVVLTKFISHTHTHKTVTTKKNLDC